jgi:hypothetical protein
VTYFKDMLSRLRLARIWIALQFVLTLLLLLAGIAWTRIPEKHAWQVALTLILPLLLIVSALELEAGTIRRLAHDDGGRVKLVWGALTLLVWLALGWVVWALLDWCDDQVPQWGAYLHSLLPARARASLFTGEHIKTGLAVFLWILRWVVVPAKIIPCAVSSAQVGWRLPWGRALRLLFNWRWWLAVALAAVLGVWLPGHFFAAPPHGTPSAQVWLEGFKLAGTYLLAVGCWVLLLAWNAVLFAGQEPPAENALDRQFFSRLTLGRKWVAAFLGWLVLFVIADLAAAAFPDSNSWLNPLTALVLLPLLIVLTTLLARSMMASEPKPARIVWGLLSVLLAAVVGLAIAIGLSLWYHPVASWIVGWFVAPALLLPFAAASAVWGLRLPWRKSAHMLLDWKWWLGILWAAVAGVALPAVVSAAFADEAGHVSLWNVCLRSGIGGLLEVGTWVILLAWLAVLFGSRQLPGSQPPPPDDALLPVPVPAGPPERTLSARAEVPPPGEDSKA